MKYQAMEELLDQTRAVGRQNALAAMKGCVVSWAAMEAVNAIVGAFYEVGFSPEEMDVKDKGSDNTLIVQSGELEPLAENDREDFRGVVEDLFEKRMGSLYGIYLNVSFPEDQADTMLVQIDVKDDPKVIAAAFRDKASRI